MFFYILYFIDVSSISAANWKNNLGIFILLKIMASGWSSVSRLKTFGCFHSSHLMFTHLDPQGIM